MPKKLPSNQLPDVDKKAFIIDSSKDETDRLLDLFRLAGKNVENIGSIFVMLVENAPVPDSLEIDSTVGGDFVYVYTDDDSRLLLNQLDTCVYDPVYKRVIGSIVKTELLLGKKAL
jgi:hypothetical protein